MSNPLRWRTLAVATFIFVLVSGILISGAQQEITSTQQQEITGAQQEQEQNSLPSEDFRPAITPADCTYLQDPLEFRLNTKDRLIERSATTGKVAAYVYAVTAPEYTLDANAVPRKNLIDNAIFNRMAGAGIQSAPISTDAEFLRRVMLDLTGRIPSANELTAFLADPNPAKRDGLIDSLIGTPEFVDKWTMFFGDLYKNTSNASNVARGIAARDAFYTYIRDAIVNNKPYSQMASEMITATGNSTVVGQASWVVGGMIPMGPAQDIYDGEAAHFAQTFLGLSTVDCLLCHDGNRHLDAVNLWGARQTRMNMWGLSAYFSRVQLLRDATSGAYTVNDLATGDYRLNTTTGNRSARQPINGVNIVQPRNPFVVQIGTNAGNAGVMAGETRRAALARQIIPNIQFSRAIVNYIWEEMMVEALVSPSGSFDPARIDAANPPPAGWSMQATNPELLNELAIWFRDNGYDVRGLIRAIAQSSAYQLSSTYPGTWSVDYVPYYARKYARRLDAEEVHDAIIKATGIMTTYTQNTASLLPPVQWAMQLVDPREPGGNGGTVNFLNSFGRGDRDQRPRRSDGSLLQSLNMMNNGFVMTRIHQANAGSRVATILSQTQDPATIVRLLFQNTLSRNPTAEETALFVDSFRNQTVRVASENLQWVLLNKLDFLFNY